MHKGRVAEMGNHEELLARRGLYWRLFQIQFGHQYGAEAMAEEPDLAADDDSELPVEAGSGYGFQHT
jgi:hypothetical protein